MRIAPVGQLAAHAPQALELAGATFEFCKDEQHVLSMSRAREFVVDYRAAGGPVDAREIDLLMGLMRIWLRRDALGSLAWGSTLEDAYVQGQVRAFHALVDASL